MSGQSHIVGIGRKLIGKTKKGDQFPFKIGVSEIRNMQEEKIYIVYS
jgi:hypothetical protein